MTSNIVIVAATRTAIGSFGGSLSSIPAHKLGSAVISSLLQKTGLDSNLVDEVILGQVLTAGTGQNPARQAFTSCMFSAAELDFRGKDSFDAECFELPLSNSEESAKS